MKLPTAGFEPVPALAWLGRPSAKPTDHLDSSIVVVFFVLIRTFSLITR